MSYHTEKEEEKKINHQKKKKREGETFEYAPTSHRCPKDTFDAP